MIPATVNELLLPGLPVLEKAATRQQRVAHLLQALYLAVLLLAPVSRLLPIQVADRSLVDDRVAAGLLLAAVVLRLVMRHVSAESDWVRARRKAEEERSAAWRRAATATVGPDDGPIMQEIGAADVAERWTIYLTHRIDDQIAYFTRRAREHESASRRWVVLRLVLTAACLGIAAFALVAPESVTPGTTGVVSAVLATTEAWIQFRRSEVIATSYREAQGELLNLRVQNPTDETTLAAAVDAVELAIERERWKWVATMSVTDLASLNRRRG